MLGYIVWREKINKSKGDVMNLKSLNFSVLSRAGDRLKFETKVNVDSAGIFGVVVPEFLKPVADLMIDSYPMVSYKHNKKREVLVSGKVFKDCEKFMNDVVIEYLKCDVKEEKVIVYSTDIHACYYKMSDGSLSQNHSEGDGNWVGSTTSNYFSTHYRVGLAVCVFTKKTFTRGDKTEIEYTEFSDRENEDCLENKINHLHGMSVGNPNRDGLSEIPYSDSAALFFYGTAMSMCRLADRMKTFFGDQSLLLEAIQKNTLLLPE